MRRFAFALAIALIATAPLNAEQKNVKVLTGLSDFELVRSMHVITASLSVNCGFCHAPTADGKGLDFASDAKKEKQTARQMIAMVKSINTQNFEGRPQVSCNTCHRGAVDPVGIVPLPQPAVYPARPEPNEPRPAMPTRDEVVAGYAAAIGNPSPAMWESRLLTGTREGSDNRPLEMTVNEAPGMAHTFVKLGNDTMEQAATTTAGWTRNGKIVRPLTAAELMIFNSLEDAYAPPLPQSIPADARARRLTQDGRDVYVVFFRKGAGTRERMEFDATTGLLVRRVTLADTPVGISPQQTDYSDWRDVGGGVKYPFTVRVSPVDARLGSTRHYTAVKLGARLDEKMMEMPK